MFFFFFRGAPARPTGRRAPAWRRAGLRLRLSAAQARASAPGDLPSPAPGFQAASCSLFLDPTKTPILI